MFPILQKAHDTVSAEDLETLQNDIERKLVDVVTSKWSLKREFLALNSSSPDPNNATTNTTETIPTNETGSHSFNTVAAITGNNGTDDSTASDASQSDLNSVTISGIKRSLKVSNDRPSKRFRPNNSNTPIGTFPKRSVQSKHKSRFRTSVDESRSKNKKQIVRNEAPDKLWPFVEQFCATPSSAQLQDLEDMINGMENDKDYFKVPSVARKDSPSKNDNTCSKSQNSKGLGALTQRLVSSLIEDSDNIDSSINDSSSAKKKKNVKPKGGKSIDMNNAKNLEKRIRQGLEEYDILDQQDDIPYGSEEDELLRRLVGCQHELFTIQKQNKDYMQRLLKKARKHLDLQNEREKLREANADVIAAYQRLVQAKQRKRNPTKKEKDAAIKALKVQEAIFRKCDELYLSGLNRN